MVAALLSIAKGQASASCLPCHSQPKENNSVLFVCSSPMLHGTKAVYVPCKALLPLPTPHKLCVSICTPLVRVIVQKQEMQRHEVV